MIVIIGVVAVLFGLLLFGANAARKKAQRITCVNHLMQFGLAFRLWSGDNTNLYPMSLSTNLGGTKEYIITGQTFRHFQVMSNELSTPLILVCPSDTRRPAADFGSNFGNTNLSYFVGVDAEESNPQAVLTGDRNITGGTRSPNGLVEFTGGKPVGWSSELHDGVGNVGMADGSVQQFSIAGLQQAFQQSSLATNRLAIP